MLDELEQALTRYETKWEALGIAVLKDCTVDAVGWKVGDEQEYMRRYQELRPSCDKLIETWMNGRWIAKLHLKDDSLQGGIKLIKLMQRRPSSEDALGLDHVDFICKDISQIEAAMQTQTAVRWSWESNDIMDDYRWISVWFDGTEAKIKDHSVLDTVAKELQQLNR